MKPPPHQPTAEITSRGGNPFDRQVVASTGRPLANADLSTIQVNIGLACNLACRHCHVQSSPKRHEQMDWATIQAVLDLATRAGSSTLDLTGGAPEMNPHFRRLVTAASTAGLHVIVRTNLTVMLAEGYRDLPAFLAGQAVHLVASLPCYLEQNVNQQRGRGVYADSIQVIQQLNRLGYGIHEELLLDLVYNPVGPTLPPDQADLEAEYHRQLDKRFGIRFTRLLTLTNMPIGRFLHDLQRDGRDAAYLQLLRDHFNPATLGPLMCRHQVHVGHDGTLYDCDFNYALNLPVNGVDSCNIRHADPGSLLGRPIATGEHCFGCTAGCGSSCSGALV